MANKPDLDRKEFTLQQIQNLDDRLSQYEQVTEEKIEFISSQIQMTREAIDYALKISSETISVLSIHNNENSFTLSSMRETMNEHSKDLETQMANYARSSADSYNNLSLLLEKSDSNSEEAIALAETYVTFTGIGIASVSLLITLGSIFCAWYMKKIYNKTISESVDDFKDKFINNLEVRNSFVETMMFNPKFTSEVEKNMETLLSKLEPED